MGGDYCRVKGKTSSSVAMLYGHVMLFVYFFGDNNTSAQARAQQVASMYMHAHNMHEIAVSCKMR